MENDDKDDIQNNDIKKPFKLRSSLKKSFRNVSEIKDDSMECQDDTLAAPRRRVSFAASNTVKPFVNDPEKNTIWDNTYEEVVDHTNSNSIVSVGSSVCTIQSTNQITKDINVIISSCEETSTCVKSKLLSKTVIETIDMEYTCQFEIPHDKDNLQVINPSKTVNNGSNMNHTMYPNADMSFTCVFPIRDLNPENHGLAQDSNLVNPDEREDLGIGDLNSDLSKRDADLENKVDQITESPYRDMSLTCAFPANVVNSENKIENIENLKPDMILTVDGTKNPIEDMSFTCVFPTRGANTEKGINGGIENLNKDMSLACVFTPQNVNSESKVVQETKDHSTDMSLTCVFTARDVKPESNVDFKTGHSTADMSLACSFPNPDFQNKEQINGETKNLNTDMSLTCLFPANRDVNGKQTVRQETNHPSTDMNLTSESKIAQDTKYLSKDMSLTCAFPARDVNPESNIDRKTGHSNADMSLSYSFPNSDMHNKENICLLNKVAVSDKSSGCVFPSRDVNQRLNPKNINGETKNLNIDMSLTCIFPANRDVNSKQTVGQETKDPGTDMSLTCVFPVGNGNSQNHVHPGSEISTSKNSVTYISSDIDCIIPQNSGTDEIFSIVTTEDEPIVNETCNLLDAISSIIGEEEGRSSNVVNEGKQDNSADFKPSTFLLHFSDALSSAQKHSSLSNASIYNTQQLLDCKSFNINEISGVKLINKSTEATSEDKSLGSAVESGLQSRIVLNNIETKQMFYRQSKSTLFTLQKCKEVINQSDDVCSNARAYLSEFLATIVPVSKLEKEVKRLSLAYSITSLSNSLINNDSDVELQEEEVDKVLADFASKHHKIMEVFQNARPTLLQLISFEDNDCIFTTYFSAVKISVSIHPEDGRVVEIKVESQLNPNPGKSLFFMQNAFLVQYIMNKVQMCNLKSSLGLYFDMLSLLDQVQIITDKCIDFAYEFLMVQRQFRTLKMGKGGVVSFNILHTNPPIFWTVEFQMASPETILQASLKVSSKWSFIDDEHFQTILRNIEPGIDCIKIFATEVLEYFNRVGLRITKMLTKN